MRAGVWKARALSRDLRERNYNGVGCDRSDPEPRTVAIQQFETRPGKQAQVDWGHGRAGSESSGRPPSSWVISRLMMAEVGLDRKIGKRPEPLQSHSGTYCAL